jgi:formylglycine-generating enzyme required for sulfatase activity
MRAHCDLKGHGLKLAQCVSAFLIFHFSFLISARAQDSVMTVPVAEGVKVEMVWVKGGTFTMGNNETPKGVKLTYAASKPEHRVTVDSYYIGRYEVTQGLWRAVMGYNPSKFTANDSLPVENVTWEEAQQFVLMLSQMSGRRFRLPTEAEWEYAARGGSKFPFAGCERGQLESYAWYCTNSERTTHPVGRLGANPLGLYDMSGNVAEWCQDWMNDYSADAQTNPRGPKTGENKVLRGGHYNGTSPQCTVYDRSWYLPSGKSEYYGLRVVMEVGE